MKSVIITGALGGIGKALCKIFKEDGYFVIGLDKNASDKIASCDESFSFDLARIVTDDFYRKKHLDHLLSFTESLTVLVNNAAIQLLSGLSSLHLKDWQQTLNVNLTAPLLLSQWALPILAKNSGSIVNISSIHQNLTKPRFVSYATSKSALVGLTKALAVDLAGQIRVNSISPAAIETDMLRAGFDFDETALDMLRNIHPVHRIGYPEEVAKLALFLASEDANFINGANLQLDGGISSVLHDLN